MRVDPVGRERRAMYPFSCVGSMSVLARSLAVALLALLGVASVGVQGAGASEAPYGEVTRFGGYDATGKVPGKFALPVGFAVEPENPATKETNCVYVLDLIRNDIRKKRGLGEGEAFLEYGLQKLSGTGAVLGSTTFTIPYTDAEKFSDAHPLFGLAVDPARKRIYTIVESMAEENPEVEEPVAVVGELVAWNTEPNSEDKLVGASGYPQDGITKSASLISGESVLQPSSVEAEDDLYAADGIVVTPATGDITIEAQKGISDEGVAGPTVLKQLDPETGAIVASWEAVKVAPEDQQGGGLFASTEESGAFGVNLYEGAGKIGRLAKVGSDFKTETLLTEDNSKGNNLDEAPIIDLESTPNRRAAEAFAFQAFAGGSPVTQLIGSSHLYAALYGIEDGGSAADTQSETEPWLALGSEKPLSKAWITGREGIAFDDGWAHMGIRLFEAGGKIVDTLGGGKPNSPGTSQLGTCSVDFPKASLAAGSEGTIFVLTQPNKSALGPHKENLTIDDEIIEFAPGGKYACPTITDEHEFEVNGEEVHGQGGEPTPTVTLDEGVKTKFDAISLDQPLAWSPSWVFTWKPEPLEWTPFAFEWNFGDEPKAGENKDGYTEIQAMKPNGDKEYLWPKPEAEHEYTKPGTYEAKLRVYGDYGTSVFPIKVIVLGGGSPTANFTAPAHLNAGALAVFNAAASTPAPGGPTIEDYHWEFGDGSKPVNTNQRTQSHTFAKAGEYEVTLTIRDNEGSNKDAKIEQKVVVEPGLEPPQPLSAATQGEQLQSEEKPAPGASAPPVETAAKTPPATKTPTVVKKQPQTRVQKLAAALKSCEKLKTRKKRESCEQQAKKRYAPPRKRTTQKQGSKKK